MEFLSGLFNKAKQLFRPLGSKHSNKQPGLFNKSKSLLGNLTDLMNNKSAKAFINNVSEYVPGVQDLYNSGKKYVNIANNYINNDGLKKKLNRGLNKISHLIDPGMNNYNHKKKKELQPITMERVQPQEVVDKDSDYYDF